MTLNEVVSPSTVRQLGKSAGLEPKQVQDLIGSALPVLLEAMSRNASDEAGAQSLARALANHVAASETKVAEVDAVDGTKIINHILGDSGKPVTRALSEKAGVNSSQGAVVLALLAPLLLKALGLQAQQNNTPASGLAGMLGALLGGSSQNGNASNSSNAAGSLLGALLGGSSQGSGANSSGTVGSLLSALLAPREEEEEEEEPANDLGGGSLSGMLFDLITGK